MASLSDCSSSDDFEIYKEMEDRLTLRYVMDYWKSDCDLFTAQYLHTRNMLKIGFRTWKEYYFRGYIPLIRELRLALTLQKVAIRAWEEYLVRGYIHGALSLLKVAFRAWQEYYVRAYIVVPPDTIIHMNPCVCPRQEYYSI